MPKKLMLVMIATAGILHAPTVSALPEATLNKCQQTAAKEVNKYAAALQKAAGKCLNKISAERIQDATVDAAGAASSCAAALRKLVNTEDATKTLAAKTEAKIEKICDPAAADSKAEHTVADVLGTGATVLGDSIQADDLGVWCASFGGDGTVNNIQEWIDCQLAAATCEARQQLAAEYPNALAWLADVRPDIVGLGPDQKYVDAVTALDALDAALDSNGDNHFDLACGPGGVLRTGQTTCYNAAGTVIACAGTKQDGELQKGTARRHTDNGDGTVTDTVTGLMWEKLSDDGSIHDWDDTTYSATTASTKITSLNTASFAGHTDWRLPNVNELQTLAKYGAATPAIDAAFNTACAPACTVTTCSCTMSDGYWSSTTYELTPSYGWVVDFAVGYVFADGKPSTYYVRGVRGGS